MRYIIFPLTLLLPLACVFAQETSSLTSPLAGLSLPHAGVAKHEGSWDRGGGNGDARPVEPGKTITLLDYNGAGIIKRFWVTIAPRAEMHIHRQAILRMYWDGEEKPSVECPIGDFFGVGFGEQKDYISLPLNETSGGYNCYWPMPFHKSARWTLENRSDRKIDAFYYNIDFTAYDALPPEQRHFHAHWRRENPTTRGSNYTILDTTGSGHLVGVALFMQARLPHDIGFLEGDEMVYVDGDTPGLSAAKTRIHPDDKDSPHGTTFVGTGTEDFFSSGWYFDRGPYSAPFHGCIIKDELMARISAYRWYIEDAIPFTQSIRFTIEHGTNNDHEADYSSVAYFYASGDVKPAPALPADAKDLLPLPPREVRHFKGAIEAERRVETAKATAGQLQIQNMNSFSGEWSGEAQLFWTGAGQGESLTLPVKVKDAGEYEVIAYLTKAPDYAIVTAKVADGAATPPIDLYDAAVKPSGPIPLGKAKLAAGNNDIVFTITGKNARSTNTLVGIDAIELKAK